MKGLALFFVTLSLLPGALVSPFFGMMYYNWFGLMKPEWLFWGFPHSLPMTAIVAAVTFIGWVVSRERKLPPFDATTLLIIAMIGWGGVTTFFALNPSLSGVRYVDMLKVYFFALIMYSMLTTTRRVQIALWVLGLSIAAWGAKGGWASLISRGAYRIQGPEHSIISDNNDFAVVLVTITPLLLALRALCKWPWQRHGMSAIIGLNLLGTVFTYSRGGLLGLGAMGVVLWWQSRRKLAGATLAVLGIALFMSFAPPQFFNRAATIGEYQADSSAQERLYMWQSTWAMVMTRPVAGSGFWWLKDPRNLFRASSLAGLPPPEGGQLLGAAHSIYFEQLGDHGFVGLALYLGLLGVAFRNGLWLARQARDGKGDTWIDQLGRMVPASLVGFMVGGAFVTVSTYEGYYQLFIIVAAARSLIERQARAAVEETPARLALSASYLQSGLAAGHNPAPGGRT